ncbi:hypothetical protein MA1A_gp22 [Pectobacterium phage MA1A]|nr:hypothetical protein MA6_gp40 [Pectobacterium phage MA6]QGH45318.1 hypothetical protein MA1A_gp22 [Pectobacterium phage MA1A]
MLQRISSANLVHAMDAQRSNSALPTFSVPYGTTTTTYGLTREMVHSFRCLIPYGLPHDRAMMHLKRLYDNNKYVALNPRKPN